MNKRRTHLEVIHDILEAVKNRNGRTRPTRILYKANLSHQMMEFYLKELISKCLLTEQKLSRGRTYFITNEGFQFLENYGALRELTNSFGLNVY